jgi:hypothetical protein
VPGDEAKPSSARQGEEKYKDKEDMPSSGPTRMAWCMKFASIAIAWVWLWRHKTLIRARIASA